MNCLFAGSGSLAAMATFEDRFKPDMSVSNFTMTDSYSMLKSSKLQILKIGYIPRVSDENGISLQ